MRCECYRIGGPFIAEDPNCPIHGYEAQAREKEERAYRESEEEMQNELLARIIALEEKIDAMPQCTQPAPSVPEGWKLVPTAESRHPGIYKMLGALHTVDNTPGASEWESYAAFLEAAPEAKP